MSSNLPQKIALLVDDLEPLDKYARARTILRFVEAELGLLGEVKHLDESDILHVQATAGTLLGQTVMGHDAPADSFAKDPAFARTILLVEATVRVLREKNLLPHLVGYRRKKAPFRI
jgi:hypothetical protein